MTKLQAAMKESVPRRQALALARISYKVGSCFKGCCHCGDYDLIEVGGREVKRYTSGYNVYRSYKPWATKWTWWCYDCGSKDLRCWEPDAAGNVEEQLGKEPRRGARSVMIDGKLVETRSLIKAEQRKEQRAQAAPSVQRAAPKPAVEQQIEALEAKVRALMGLLK